MATLGFERGSFTLGQQVGFRRELERIMELAQRTGAADDPSIRQRLSNAWIGVEIMRLNALRTLSTSGRDFERTASIGKLYWSTWHRELGELAMDVLGMASTVVASRRTSCSPSSRSSCSAGPTRSTPAPARSSATSSPSARSAFPRSPPVPSPAPAYPAAHNLLAGRIVLVTAAAGTGIGFSTAKRAAEEGATVVVSDCHERRLGEAAEQLAEITGETPLAVPCDVRNEDQVQALFDAVYERHGRLDVLVNNAGLGGEVNARRHDRRAVDRTSSTSR